MGDKTKIEWTDATWTPIRARSRASGKVGWYCVRVSEGCRNCYAARMNERLGTGVNYAADQRKKVELFLDDNMLTQPLRWTRARMVFVCSMTDLFADFVEDEWLEKVFAVMALSPRHTFQVLTKRPERMLEFSQDHRNRVWRTADGLHEDLNLKQEWDAKEPWPLPNVQMLVSVEDQETADERIPLILQTNAAVRGISYEPAVGPVDFECFLGDLPEDPDGAPYPGKIDWLICGGESGPGARPMHPDWARTARDQAVATGTAFHFKQWGEWSPLADTEGRQVLPFGSYDVALKTGFSKTGKKVAGRLLDGRTWDENPGVKK